MQVSMAAPTTGGILDHGEIVVLTKPTSGGSYTTGPRTPYCSPDAGTITDAYANVWSIASTGAARPNAIMCNGVYADPTGEVERMLLVGDTIWQRNSADDWWSYKPTTKLTDPTNLNWGPGTKTAPSVTVPGLTASTSYDVTAQVSNVAGMGPQATPIPVTTKANGVPPQPGTVPPAAAAAGYNTRTFGPKLIMGNPWYNETGVKLTTHPDGSVLIEHGGAPFHYNADILTTRMLGGGNFDGPAFGGGAYFEAVLSIQNPVNSAGGWPSWWSNDVEIQCGNSEACRVPPWGSDRGIWFEPDFMEHFSSTDYGCANHNWYGNIYNYQGGDDQPLSAHKNCSGINLNTPHKYGYLWVPAVRGGAQGRIEAYFDDVMLGGYRYNWFDVNNPPPYPPNNGSCTGAMDTRHYYLVLGTGPSNPMTVHSVNVFQRNASANQKWQAGYVNG
jgi:hypothetical protein